MQFDTKINFVELILSTFETSSFISTLQQKKELHICLPAGFIPFLLTAIESEVNIFCIAKNEIEAESIYEATKSLGRDVLFFPEIDVIPFSNALPSPDKLFDRMNTLYRIFTSPRNIIITTMEAFLRKLPPKDLFEKSIHKITKNQKLLLERLVEILVISGYHREHKVLEIGTFSVRGDIIDLYPPIYPKPIRIEFFEDEIENIRFFELESQKSTTQIDSFILLPANEFYIEKEIVPEQSETLLDETKLHSHFIKFYNNLSSILDYSSYQNLVLFDEHYKKLEEAFTKKTLAFVSDSKLLYFNFEKTIKDTLKVVNHHFKTPEVKFFEEIYPPAKLSEGFSRAITLMENEYLKNGYTIFITVEHKEIAERLKNILARFSPRIIQPDEKIDEANKVYIVIIDYETGFEIKSKKAKILVLSESDISGKKRLFRKKIRQIDSFFEDVEEIKEGEYVVHINYGIGIFRGIERINVLDKEKDYILLEYAQGEKLYVPFEQSNLIGKYFGDPNKKVELDSLGTKSWIKKREKVQKSIEEFANKLVTIYAKRMTLKGHSFSKDTIWQKEFEDRFEYIETPDQLKVIEEIKRDMESPKLMDRLLCGDVGFGKTEVAMRAAFKAVMDGKQVALVAPTTVLVEQHYFTFTKRFEGFPVKIEYLSRLVEQKKEKEILEGIKNHKIDIIIGTHKLFSEKIQFHNLGLVIIDEEHKFGVEHKEKLKERYPLVDFLSLSATPIPRTLNMALSFLRDISLLQTPPDMRIPVETYVGEFSTDIIKYAIEKELERNGQIYFVHNTIKRLAEYAYLIEQIVPQAKTVVAHGRMDEEELEKAFVGFLKGKYNVFVSTAIIDSGLDIPNANTIIVTDAHKFGLSQLYQLKGRVGRSKQQAYAYFLYPQDKILTEKAEKRLYVIQEYTELGSGFNIALRDLEIRGAGNILGKEQHGNIIAVGYDLYIKLLKKEIDRLKGKETFELDTLIDLKYDAYIPDFYISDDSTRMEVYKKILSVKNEVEISELKEELVDRFGNIPDEVDALFEISRLKIVAAELGIESIIEKNDEIEFTFSKHSKVNVTKVIQMISSKKGEIFIKPSLNNKLFMKSFESNIYIKVKRLVSFLKEIKEK